MAIYKKAILTQQAIELLTKTVAGNKLEFTRMAVGDGQYKEDVDLKNIRYLNNEKQSATITSVAAVNAKVARIRGVVTNENLKQSYYLKEVGLFAKDPDKGEILFSYAQAEIADLMPSHANRLPCSKTIDMLTVVNDTENIIVNYNPADIVSREDLEEILKATANLILIPKGEDIPISERKKDTFYIKVIDKLSDTQGTQKLYRVSPNMGLEILD